MIDIGILYLTHYKILRFWITIVLFWAIVVLNHTGFKKHMCLESDTAMNQHYNTTNSGGQHRLYLLSGIQARNPLNFRPLVIFAFH